MACRNPDIPERLDGLLAELCDGSPTPEEVAELERLGGTSASARRYVVAYLQLHGELLWSSGRLAAVDRQPVVVDRQSVTPRALVAEGSSIRPWQRLRSLGAVFLVSTVCVIILGLLFAKSQRPLAVPIQVAHLAETHEAQWADSRSGKLFFQGDSAELMRGFVRIEMESGTSVILEGPAKIGFLGRNSFELHSGRLAATVPKEAFGFSVATPAASVVDLGTEFGVTASGDGGCEVCVFAGAVQVEDRKQPVVGGSRRFTAGDIVRVTRVGGGLRFIEQVGDSLCYVRNLPPPPPFPFREAVANHPALIHHYAFEGPTPVVRLDDQCGSLHLIETVMLGGAGTGSLTHPIAGFDRATQAVEVRRSQTDSNMHGKALQSEREFIPPARMTIELLLRFDGFPAPAKDSIATAVATRADAKDCAFFLIVVEDGQLAHLLDADADWVETGFIPKTGEWYYVASTFEPADGNRTKINTFVASLSDEHPQLVHVVKGHVAEGTAAVGRLGVGKGFDDTTAHAYPWSGALDEIAVYNEVLGEPELQQHLRLLCRRE